MRVSLDSNMSNIPAFIDSLYTPEVRDYGAVNDHIVEGKLFHSFADPKSRGLILKAWLAAWQESQGDPFDARDFANCPETDGKLLAFIAAYIKRYSLRLCVPDLEYVGLRTGHQAIYRITSDDRKWHSFRFLRDGSWQYGGFDDRGAMVDEGGNKVVARFLKLLYHGAHTVIISSASDLGGQGLDDFRVSLSTTFLPQGLIRSDPGNSHYTSTVNLRGLYFPVVDSDTLPRYNPLIVAFLAGYTADFKTNVFTQLEGWQARVPPTDGGPRHHADYQANKDTLWNFSTFGACAYSEKRCTPVFLADDRFDLEIRQDTHMPHYVGAGSRQGWMDVDLLEI
jgi:hypothetical protein